MTKERIEELRVWLLTLNQERWKPTRKGWGNNVAALLALLNEKAEPEPVTAMPSKVKVTRKWLQKALTNCLPSLGPGHPMWTFGDIERAVVIIVGAESLFVEEEA